MYRDDFATAIGKPPRDFQVRVAEALGARRHVLLRAPTGAGKTLAVLMPFLLKQPEIGARRLIYTLPLRTLVQSIHAEAAEHAKRFGKTASIQTGAQPDDPFFDKSDIVVTTYDQLLSGYLCGPYSLSARLHNMNAAVVAGNLIVFDEFHLMDPSRAFLTGIHCLKTFGDSTLSVWMTATATSPLCDYLKSELDAAEISLDESELQAVYHGRDLKRTVHKVNRPLHATDILDHPSKRVLVVVNRVARAQKLYRQVKASGREAILLHARFFAGDRERQRLALQESFGEGATGPAIAIATQVVEAGLDISAEVLLTELCPMNALVQRAGRCARFEGEQGEIFVFQVESPKPYEEAELNNTWETVQHGADLDPSTAAQWVESVHRQSDNDLIEKSRGGMKERREVIVAGIQRCRDGGVSHLIRENSDTVSVMISRNPVQVLPREREMISVWRTQLNRVPSGWTYDPDTPGFWKRFTHPKEIGFIAALDPANACYTEKEGLVFNKPGDTESPPASRPEPPIAYQYRREPWIDHTRRVVQRAADLIDNEVIPGGLLDSEFQRAKIARYLSLAAQHHDLGKLQTSWDTWAERYQRQLDPGYVHECSLAHTDFNPRNDEHQRAQRMSGHRPPHAAASAFFAASLLREAGVPPEEQIPVLAAIISHHGGWFQPARRIDPLSAHFVRPAPTANDREKFGRFIGRLFDDQFEEYWPIAAIVMAYLRRADQKATEEFQTE